MFASVIIDNPSSSTDYEFEYNNVYELSDEDKLYENCLVFETVEYATEYQIYIGGVLYKVHGLSDLYSIPNISDMPVGIVDLSELAAGLYEKVEIRAISKNVNCLASGLSTWVDKNGKVVIDKATGSRLFDNNKYIGIQDGENVKLYDMATGKQTFTYAQADYVNKDDTVSMVELKNGYYTFGMLPRTYLPT